jgi:hypothetical protein
VGTRKRFLAAMLLAGIVPGSNVLGCGDKFLVFSRGTRYQRAPVSREPAAILIYLDPLSEVSKGLGGVPVDATLRKAGYRPTMVETAGEFDRALNQGGWDLVLVATADAPAVAQRAKDLGILPVAFKPTPAELKQTRKLFPVVLQAPTKSETLVDTVDHALASRPKSQQRIKRAAI